MARPTAAAWGSTRVWAVLFRVRLIVPVLLCMGAAAAYSQQPTVSAVDSLERKLAAAREDTTRAWLLVDLAREHARREEYEKAIGHTDMVFDLVRRADGPIEVRTALKKAAGRAHMIAGRVTQRQGDLQRALDHFLKDLRIQESVRDSSAAASAHNNIGTVYSIFEDYEQAFIHFQEGLRSAGEDEAILTRLYMNLGNLHGMQSEREQAMGYYSKSLLYAKARKDQRSVAQLYNNMAGLCVEADLQKALLYAMQSLKTHEELEDRFGVSAVCATVGLVHAMMSTAVDANASHPGFGGGWIRVVTDANGLDSAEHYYRRALRIGTEIGSDDRVQPALAGLGGIHLMRGEPSQALHYLQRATSLAEVAGKDGDLILLYEGLSVVHERLGDHVNALVYNKRLVRTKDKVFDQEKQKALGRLEAKAEYERAALIAKKEREQADALLNARIDKQALQRNSLMGGLGLTLLLASAGYRGYQNKRRAYAEVQVQKDVLEERNKDITDSIRYAQRIQEAILPSDPAFGAAWPDSFILDRPKDIVSGDFYWFERKGDRVYLAVVDCTGHGVPGALMTIVANNGLTKALNETVDAGPAALLDRLNAFVNESLHRTYEKNVLRDGMDISLCMFDLAERRLRFAGANRPLLLIRDQAITEIKGDKHPVGIFVGETLKPFTEHEVQLQENDRIYLFTDGFVDQFGGDQGKKFMSARLKALLLSVQDKPMADQQRVIDEVLTGWMGGLDQVDDICMIGLRISLSTA
jgi:serine phosphatase RsbU (regulator of sigma subunit)